MKNLKVVLVALSLLSGSVVSLKAEGEDVYAKLGPLSLTIPWQNVSATYLYDAISKNSLVGGEVGLAKAWNVQATFGAVTTLEGKGDPFVGVNLELQNPAPNWAFLGDIKPGVFGGYSWNRGSAIAGVKASKAIF